MSEEYSFQFDKFMNDIVHKEEAINQPVVVDPVITPQREYIQRYRELPQNRTRWSK